MGRLLRVLFLPVSLLLLAAGATLVPLPAFVEVPSPTVSLDEKVVVELDGAGALQGDYLLTVVSLRRATVAGLAHALVDPRVDVRAEGQILPPGQDDSTYFDRQRLLFQATAGVAAAVGLAAAGFDVDPTAITGDGVIVLRVLEGAPADGTLRPGDVIVGVDDVAVGASDDLRAALAAGPDEPRRLTLRRLGETVEVEVTPRDLATRSGPIVGIGVEIETVEPRIDLPVGVEIDSGRIGGPSAGLLLALTVFDKASEVDLAAGRRIAGTGLLAPDGTVGPVGGVRQKMRSAQRDGAQLFLVPRAQLDRARAIAPEGLQLLGVGTFDEALDALRTATATSLRAGLG